MKVIKHLKKESPQYRLKAFFKEMPLLTRILLCLICLISILLQILSLPIQLSFYCMIDSRPISEMIIFVIAALTDFQKEQRKGSLYFLFGFLSKSSFLIFLKQATKLIFKNVITFQSGTSYPLLFLLTLAFRQMIVNPQERRYFLIDPFQMKKLFYPLFLVLILELIQLRIDILYSFLLGVVLHFIKFDNCILFISRKIDQKLISERLIRFGVLKTGCSQIQMGQIDRVVTNNSVVLEE